MKKTMKLALFAALILLVTVVTAVFCIDSIAETGVEQGGTYALGVPMDVRGMDVGILAGGVAIDGVRIDNPAGFDTPYFLEMGEGRVGVSLGTLMEDKVVLPELSISGMKLNLEQKLTKSNYGVILDNLNAFTTKLQSDAAPQEGKKFVIRKVLIENVLVQVQLLPIGGKATRLPIKIERIELADVGSNRPDGVQFAEVTALMMEAILHAVLERAGDLMPGDMASSLKGGLDALPGLGKKAVSLVGNVGDAAAKELGKVGKELEKGLADLLKPKNDK